MFKKLNIIYVRNVCQSVRYNIGIYLNLCYNVNLRHFSVPLKTVFCN